MRQIGIVGTGMIGSSLAALFTGNGYPVTVLAVNRKQAQAGEATYDRYYRDLMDKGLVSPSQAALCKRNLTIVQDYAGLAGADILFECVVEQLDVKYGVYREIERHCTRFQAIASTTSALSADDLARGIEQKDKLMVAHPWNPPHLVPCVEVVCNRQTSAGARDALVLSLESTGREVVVMKKGAPGFIGNRLQHALYREAVSMVEQGIATPADIDKTLRTSFGPRYSSIGIFEHFDYAGLDMVQSIEDYLFPTLCNATAAQDLVRENAAAGNLGVKTGRGVYDWSEKDLEQFKQMASEPYYRYFNWSLPQGG